MFIPSSVSTSDAPDFDETAVFPCLAIYKSADAAINATVNL